VVEEILVKPGQEVKKGEILLRLSRRKAKETLQDQEYRIAELRAKKALWKLQKENEILENRIKLKAKLDELESQKNRLKQEIAYKKSLYDGLTQPGKNEAAYNYLEAELQNILEAENATRQLYEAKIAGLEKELQLGQSPYEEQIKKYEAEREFEQAQDFQPIVVVAPSDGIVGDIKCKEAEHVSSFSTLMTFYEPHPNIVKGFVHEDLTLKVDIGQEFVVSSLKDENLKYSGKVIGLGSRIVEIPTRLRKIEVIKAYGREVLIEIPASNAFLQNEKVSIVHQPNPIQNP
jgi:multidrug resistance efflux pump